MLRRKKDLIAGIALGLLLYKPQLMIALSAILLIKGRWRALAGEILGTSVWLSIGLILSPLAMQNYLKITPMLFDLLRLNPHLTPLIKTIHSMIPGARLLNYPTWGIHSFFGFSSLLIDNMWRNGADILSALLLLVNLFFIITIWAKSTWEPGTKSWDMMMAASISLGLLISPHLFVYDLMLLLLPFTIVWSHYSEGRNGRPLDAGPLLFWSALLYIICFFGSYISRMQLQLCKLIGFPQFAVQFSTLVILGWSYAVILDDKKHGWEESLRAKIS
jgi:hypothetical protein